MQFSDVILLVGQYLAYAATVFGISYAPRALYRFFKQMADPGYRQD